MCVFFLKENHVQHNEYFHILNDIVTYVQNINYLKTRTFQNVHMKRIVIIIENARIQFEPNTTKEQYF